MSETGKIHQKRSININPPGSIDNTDQEYEGESANQ